MQGFQVGEGATGEVKSFRESARHHGQVGLAGSKEPVVSLRYNRVRSEVKGNERAATL